MKPNRELASKIEKSTFIKQLNPIETRPSDQSMRDLRRERELVFSMKRARELRAWEQIRNRRELIHQLEVLILELCKNFESFEVFRVFET